MDTSEYMPMFLAEAQEHLQELNLAIVRLEEDPRDRATVDEIFRAAGFPIVLTKEFDKRTPSHQCGTVRFGSDPAAAPLDPFCRAFDHPNLFVVDAGFLPSSAAVNPALTIAAQALRSAEHIRRTDLGA